MSICRYVACVLLLTGLPACSSSVDRQEMSGTVTYKGNPVPYGEIQFDPDASKGTSGSQGIGEIRAGKYTTRAGFGTVVGPVTVRIIGYDGIVPTGPEAEMYKNGRPLPFGEYRTQIEIKSGEKEKNFDIPAK